jgi:two-component system, cell cycle response regulator DivK
MGKTLRLNLILKGRSILIADDVEDNRFLFGYYLKNTKAKLVYAENGKEAVEICKADSTIDLVLMDLQMPVLNGIEATMEIRKFNQQLPIIAVTAYAFPGDEQCCLDAGCNVFITKPIDSDVLIKMIRSFLGK